MPGAHAPVFTVPNQTYKHDWAFDCYAPGGTPVRVYAAPKNSAFNSTVTASVLQVKPTCGSGVVADGGYVVFVGLFHEGVRVGDVAYAHVNPDFDGNGVTNSADVNYRGGISRWGGYVGKVGSYNRSSCWQVSTPVGHHNHVEMSNIKNYSCYRSLPGGSVIGEGEYMGYLGGTYASARNKPCPAGA